MTAQTTLAATAARDLAFKTAIARIEEIMLPGARALAGTRSATSEYWIEQEHDLTGRIPFRGRTVLIWKDQGTNTYNKRTPYDANGNDSYSTHVSVQEDITPMELAELARVAALLTAEVIRKAELVTMAQVASLDSERTGFDDVAKDG